MTKITSKTQILKMEEIKAKLKDLKKPAPPVLKRFKTNDTTVPKLHELHSANPRGLMIVRDEYIGFLASLDRDDHQEDRAFYLEGWNGYGSFTYDRILRGSIYVPKLCLTLLGGIQPDKLRSYLYAAMAGGADDGMVQRFQMLVCPDDIEWEYVDRLPNKDAQEIVFKTFEALANADFKDLGATVIGEETTPYFNFTDEAQFFFKSWLTDLECNKLRQNEEPVLIEHLSKYRSLMPSLALIIHLIGVVNDKAAGGVSLEAAEKAARWCDFLEQHARRIYGLATNISQKAAINLAEKLKEGKLKNGFSARDVYAKEWSFLNSPKAAQAAIDELVERNWLRECPGDRTVKYLINPKIYK